MKKRVIKKKVTANKRKNKADIISLIPRKKINPNKQLTGQLVHLGEGSLTKIRANFWVGKINVIVTDSGHVAKVEGNKIASIKPEERNRVDGLLSTAQGQRKLEYWNGR